MKKTHTTQKRAGFTLVELLVVIALIATLSSFVVVGVLYGQRAAKATKCTSNLKNIFTSLSSVTAEGVDTGLHPRNSFAPYMGSLQGNRDVSFVWWDLVAEKMDLADHDTGLYRWRVHYSETPLQNPLSEKILGAGKDVWDSLYNDREVSHGGFAYNANLGGDVSADADEENVFTVRMSKIEDAGSTIYFGEADDEQETAGWVFKNINNAPQGNYKDSAHCMMVDGHVELIKNSLLKEKSTYRFYTDIEDKNYGAQP